MKRSFDVIISLIAIPLFIPFLLPILVVAWFQTKKFPIFIQERGLSLTNSRIKIFKIRTMKKSPVKVEDLNSIFIKENTAYHVSSFGKFLRKTGIDEFPQFFNVLKGEMSIFGPRPLMISDLELIKQNDPKIYELRNTLKSKPGISGSWQLFGNRENGLTDLIKYDLLYDSLKSFSYDSKLFFLT
ncbi:MAG: sugar transferase, partial [Ignavibacteriaceae bacterium]|nr:sugar transferase [Ignavibacteriaceae bacterium]